MLTESAFARSRRAARDRSTTYERQALAAYTSNGTALATTKAGSIMDAAMGGGSGGGGMAFVGDNRRTAQAVQGYQHFRHWVFVCVSLIAKRIAGQMVCAGYSKNADATDQTANETNGGDSDDERNYRSRKLTALERGSLPARVSKAAAYRDPNDFEILTDHEALAVLSHPNPIQRKFEFLFVSVVNLLLTGECYWIGGTTRGKKKGKGGGRSLSRAGQGSRARGDKQDEPENSVELWAVPTNWITPLHDGGMFTGYKLQVSAEQEPIVLTPEQVARTYFPDPTNLKSALSPVATQISAIRTDDYIQTSQEDAFKRGIFPNVAIKVGQQIDENGKPTGARPVLEGHQRRQIIRAVRQVWDRSVANGDPAILDGLIEEVFKLHNSPQEMDWLQSGQQIKARIFEAFGVHPFIAGEPVSVGGYAQAAIIEGVFADNVNPIADAFSETATGFLAPLYTEPAGLQVWIDPLKPRNEEMRQKEWEFARRNDDVTRDEYRAERLGLPPSEEKPRKRLLETVGGLTGSIQVLTAVGQGVVAPGSAEELFKLVFSIDDGQAAALVNPTANMPKQPMMQPGNGFGGSKPPNSQQEREQEESENEGEPNDDAPPAPQMNDAAAAPIIETKSGTTKPILSRAGIKAAHVKQLSALEEGVADALQRFFRETNQVDSGGDGKTGGGKGSKGKNSLRAGRRKPAAGEPKGIADAKPNRPRTG